MHHSHRVKLVHHIHHRILLAHHHPGIRVLEPRHHLERRHSLLIRWNWHRHSLHRHSLHRHSLHWHSHHSRWILLAGLLLLSLLLLLLLLEPWWHHHKSLGWTLEVLRRLVWRSLSHHLWRHLGLLVYCLRGLGRWWTLWKHLRNILHSVGHLGHLALWHWLHVLTCWGGLRLLWFLLLGLDLLLYWFKLLWCRLFFYLGYFADWTLTEIFLYFRLLFCVVDWFRVFLGSSCILGLALWLLTAWRLVYLIIVFILHYIFF
mmetsp:Transcript_9017/g.1312  ORF Transcript_9017/g.1312 Transcript_9017/m.1312 type:complete len:260 (+) Transcript_9017:229-1008(+)